MMTKPYKIQEVRLYFRNPVFPYPMIFKDAISYDNAIALLTVIMALTDRGNDSLEVAKKANSFLTEAVIKVGRSLLKITLDTKIGDAPIVITPWDLVIQKQVELNEYIAESGKMVAREKIDWEGF